MPQLTRRKAFSSVLLGSMALPAIFRSTKAKAVTNKRLAIIGGGMGGVATAYFASEDWAVDLFEAEPRLGGHGDTRRFQIAGEKGDHPVDMGADFFHPNTHPIYWSFLEHVGIRKPNDEKNDLTIETNATLSIFDKKSGEALFDSIHPYIHPIKSVNFLAFTEAARFFVTQKWTSFDQTVGDWLDKLPVLDDFRRDILTPWVSSISCSDVDQVRRQSAKAHFSVVAASFPVNPLQKITSYNAKIGTGGFIKLVSSQCENLSVRLSTPVTRLEEVDGKWFIYTGNDRSGPYDAVVVNAPPHISKNFFSDVAWAGAIVDALSRQEYFPAKITVHTDPVTMPNDPRAWAIQSVEVDETGGEASIFVGGIFERVNGKKINLFKSWTAKRNEQPKNVLAERTYMHPLTTPEFLAAARDLKAFQGMNGLYFSGHFTTTTDLQETALYSALETAKRLFPRSSKLSSFQKRLKDNDLAHVNYEVP